MKASFFPAAFFLIVGLGAITRGQTVQPSQGVLLQFDFNESSAWTQKPTPGAGTIDTSGGKEGSGAVMLVADNAATKGDWRAQLNSGLLAIRNVESNLGKLTLGFSLSASSARPARVRVESFDAQKRRTGGVETLIFPAAPDFYQRYAVDLSTMTTVGGGAFNPTDPFVSFTFEITRADGWAEATRHELRVDNVNYAKPAYYVRADGDDRLDGLTEKTAFARPQKALDAAQPGDIILVGEGSYKANGEQEGVAKFVRPGTPADWIVLKNYPGERPTFLSAGTWSTVKIGNAGTAPGAQTTEAPALAYLEVRGIHVRGDADVRKDDYKALIGKKDVRNNSNGMSVEGRGQKNKPHHIRFADNIVEYCPGGGFSVIAGDWAIIENNISRNNCWWMDFAGSGISIANFANFDATEGNYKHLIRNNLVTGNRCFVPWAAIGKISDGNGIIIDVNNGHLGRKLIQNNICVGNGGSGIHAFNSSHVDIINNSAYLNNASPELKWGQIFAGGKTKDIRIINNVMVAPPDKPMNFNLMKGSGDVIYANNVIFGGSSKVEKNIGGQVGEAGSGQEADASHNVRADPKFRNASLDYQVLDFHIAPESPAATAGRHEAFAPILDFDGKPRPLGTPPSAGAYQVE